MTKANAKTIARIILPYILFGSLWILLSDKILAKIVQDPAARVQWSIYKGWAYVFITGLLLTVLLHRVLKIQERAFAALRESERRFFLIFHKNPLSIAITRLRDNLYLDVNDSFINMAGITRQEAIGHTPYELNLWVDFNERERFVSQIREKQRLYGIEMNVRNKLGAIIPVLFSAELIDLDGETCMISMAQNITQLKKSEEEREHLWNQLNQVKKLEAIGLLAGGVAHDFNNILNAMMLRLELLQEEAKHSSEADEAIKDFKKDIDRAADLTRQLLLFGRKQFLQINVLDLNDVSTNLLKMLRRLLRENINFILESPLSPIWIEADHGMMEQVLMNLCINAQDAMPDGGNLLLSIHKVKIDEDYANNNPEASIGEFACIKVKDQGCGIDAITLTHIFEPFFTTKEVGKGTGLGLATVHGIVKQHNGWVEVESVEGEGSTFRVYLRLTDAIPPQSTVESVSFPKSKKSGTILFVEDEANLRNMTANVLKLHGYHVIKAANAADALECWGRHGDGIDLLFTDMVMPGTMSGLELSRTLLSLKPGLKVVISSGYSNDLLSQPDLKHQGIVYISKPYDAKKLIQTVYDLL
jgi:two-component system, cell cycle sensor histidine kinase and response regulator CckA